MARVTRKVSVFQMFERLMEKSQAMDSKINILMKEVGRLRGVIQKDRGLPADADSDAEADADAEEGVAQEQAPLEQVPRKTTTTDWGLWQSNWAVKNPDVPRDENFATKMSEAWKQWKEAHPGQTYRGFRGSDELIPRQTQAKTRRKVKTAQPPPVRRTPPPSRKPTPFAPAPAAEAFVTPQRDPDEMPRALAPPEEEEYEYPPTSPPSLKSKSKIPGLAPLSLEKPALPSREVMNSSLFKRATPAILGSPEEEYGELPVGEYHTPFAQQEEEAPAPAEEEEAPAPAEEEEAPASAEEEEVAAEEEEAPAEEEEAAAEEAPAEEAAAPAEEEESANTTPSASLNSRVNNGTNAKNNSKKSANTAPSASLNSRVNNGASKKNSKKSHNSGSPTPLGWDEDFGEINSKNKTPKSP